MGRSPHYYVILGLATILIVGCTGPPRYTSKARPAPEQKPREPRAAESVELSTQPSIVTQRERFKDIYSSLLGTRYRYGGESSTGYDCSGLMQHVFWEYDHIRLPRTVSQMYHVGRSVSDYRLKTGDLVFFNTRGRGASHVGMYLWNDMFLHASQSEGVTITSLNDDYWSPRFLGARRILN